MNKQIAGGIGITLVLSLIFTVPAVLDRSNAFGQEVQENAAILNEDGQVETNPFDPETGGLTLPEGFFDSSENESGTDVPPKETGNGSSGQSAQIQDTQTGVKPDSDKTGDLSGGAAVKVKKAKIKSVKNIRGRKVKVRIKKLKKVTGYQLRYATAKKFKKYNQKTTKKVAYTIKKLKKGKRYYIKVRAFKKAGGKKYYGRWSKVRSVRVAR